MKRTKNEWMVQNHIGERLRDVRTRRGLSARQAGLLADCSMHDIYTIEANNCAPSIMLVSQLAKAYGVSIDSLVM